MFELVTVPLQHAEEEVLLTAFMNGLKDEVRAEVRLHNSGELGEVMKLAKKVEEKNKMLGKGEGPTRKFGPVNNRPALNTKWNGSGGAGNGVPGTGSASVNRNNESVSTGPTVQSPQSSGATQSRRNSTFRHLTDEELEDRRRRKLCFRCDGPFTPGHVCQNKHLNILILGEGVEAEEEGEVVEEGEKMRNP